MGCNDKHMGSAVLLPQQHSAESQQGHGEKFKAIGAGGQRQRSAVPDGLRASLAHVSQSCCEVTTPVHISASRHVLLPGPAVPRSHLAAAADSRCCQPATTAVGSPLRSGILLL